MKQIPIHTADPYIVTVGSGVLAFAGEAVCSLTQAQKVCIVSDDTVFSLYGDRLYRHLHAAGLQVCHFTFPAGESGKSLETYSKLLQALSAEGLCRKDCILALGGGVTGDLAGFAAATYLRGIAYIQIPTTLLAMVDSSVGGKTGIDLPSGKNLCGAFYQPKAVLCDTDALQTLQDTVFFDGCAEIIKYGILYDQALFSHLEQYGPDFDREWVISSCVQHKADAVFQDCYDNGVRKLLNLGHTVGHAIEHCSNYTFSHGQAVAIGIATVCRGTKCADTQRILSLLQRFDLPVSANFSPEVIFSAAFSDKKRQGSSVDLILPKAIGNCQIVSTSLDDFKKSLEEGL